MTEMTEKQKLYAESVDNLLTLLGLDNKKIKSERIRLKNEVKILKKSIKLLKERQLINDDRIYEYMNDI